jgi:hypothetical protein
MHSDRVSGVKLLELAAEFQHIVDVAANEVLEHPTSAPSRCRRLGAPL